VRDWRIGLMPTNWRTGRKVHAWCDVDEIMRLDATGIRRAEIAERLGISESSVYRIVVRASGARPGWRHHSRNLGWRGAGHSLSRSGPAG